MRIEARKPRNSGDAALYESRPEPSLPQVLLTLARRAIERRLTDRPEPIELPDIPALQKMGASFVTLHRDGRLRGCIGSPTAWRSLAEDVTDNAARAAFSDPRFPPMGADEMFRVKLSLSLLSTPERIRCADEKDLIGQLRPGIDGLIIEDGDRHALFLPTMWEEISDPEIFLKQLKAKAGLSAQHWSESFRAFRFTAQVHHEP